MTPSERKLMETLQTMQKQIDSLIKWKEEKTRQQISLPLDEPSKNIINNA